jgi:hypothetical protein
MLMKSIVKCKYFDYTFIYCPGPSCTTEECIKRCTCGLIVGTRDCNRGQLPFQGRCCGYRGGQSCHCVYENCPVPC